MRYTILLLVVCAACTSQPSIGTLKTNIETRLSAVKGTFAVAFADIETGNTLLINEHETFHAASTMKTPVMIEVYKQVNAGKFSLTDSIEIKNEFKSIVDSSLYSLNPEDDSETELYKMIGQKRTLASLVYDMIIVSSNLATNIVIEQVGATHVTQSMRELGASDIQVLRGVEDNKAYEKGMNNTTTAYDLMVIFEKMATRKTVSPEASDAMIQILLDQRFNDIIPAQLPPEVKVAHKTGSITGVHHDSGIVMLPNGKRYVLVLLSKNLEDTNAGTIALADISRMIYEYVTANP